MLDDQIREILKNLELVTLHEIYDKFPAVDIDVINFHIEKHRPELLSSSADDDMDKKKDKRSVSSLYQIVERTILDTPLISYGELSSKFPDLKKTTLRAYKKRVKVVLVEKVGRGFVTENSDDWPLSDEQLLKFFEYIISYPSVKNAPLKKNFPGIKLSVLRELQKKVVDLVTPNDDDSNVIDHASSLDLDELTDKASGKKTHQEEPPLHNDKNPISDDGLDTRLDAVPNVKNLLKRVKRLEERCSLLEEVYVSNRSEIKSLKEKIEQGIHSSKRNNEVPYLLELLSGKIGDIGLGVIGKLLGSTLKNIGPISINFGEEK